MGKHCNNSQCFKEKNYKAKFLISSILKKKSTETILEKKKNKHQKKEKKIMLETLQQFTVFCDESYSASLHDLALFIMTCNCNLQTTQY